MTTQEYFNHLVGVWGSPEDPFEKSVNSLVHTSVEDAKSTLACSYTTYTAGRLAILQEAFTRLQRDVTPRGRAMGSKTKRKLLASAISRLLKQRPKS